MIGHEQFGEWVRTYPWVALGLLVVAGTVAVVRASFPCTAAGVAVGLLVAGLQIRWGWPLAEAGIAGALAMAATHLAGALVRPRRSA